MNLNNLLFLLQAEEASESHRFATAKLFITVKPVDSSPPQISASAVEGFVDENAPIGTKVIDNTNTPIKLTVTDADLVHKIHVYFYVKFFYTHLIISIFCDVAISS